MYRGLEAAGEVGVEEKSIERFLQGSGALEDVPAGREHHYTLQTRSATFTTQIVSQHHPEEKTTAVSRESRLASR